MAEVWNQFVSWYYATFTMEHNADLMMKYTHVTPITSIILYYIAILAIPKFFPPKHQGLKSELKWVVALWNLFLSVMSVIILFGVGVPYYHLVRNYGWWDVVCDPQGLLYIPDPLLYWGYLFALSKYFELFDSVFLLLRDPHRPLQFLHWYHHMTVLAFTWYAEYARLSVGFQFMLVNALVHSFMYFYFFLTQVGIHPPRWSAMALTVLQITQMLYGIFINSAWAYLWFTRDGECSCAFPYAMMTACLVMYGSYLYLFVDFFVDKYFRKGKPTGAKPGAKSGAKTTKKTE